MSYNIETTPHFEKELKDLAKRYKSMKQDFGKFKRVITYTTLVDENTGEVWLIGYVFIDTLRRIPAPCHGA